MTMVVPSLMVAAIVAWVLWDNRTWRKCETCGIKFKSYPLPCVLAPNAKLRSKIVPAPQSAPPRPQARALTRRARRRHELGPAAQTGLRHRHRTLPELRRQLKIIACPEPCRGCHRRSAGDRQDPHPSGPTNPRPPPCPGSPSRSIPDNLRTRKPLANASRRRRSL